MVTRYDNWKVTQHGAVVCPDIIENRAGKYVLHTDYEALSIQYRDALRLGVEMREKLEQENARLREALRIIADGIPGPRLFATDVLQDQP